MKEPILNVKELSKWFEIRMGLLGAFLSDTRYLKAVDHVNFEINEKEIVGVVGESGCGKTTLGRLILNLIKPTSGEVLFRGRDIYAQSKGDLKMLRQKMQMIFQDPYEYLSPWMSIRDIIAEPLRIHKLVENKESELDRIEDIMHDVGLTPIEKFLPKYSYELSGGERQRVMIARSLMTNPEFIVADEPVSMLDVSLRLGILNILLDLRDRYDVALLFITHDFSVARYMSERIIVMYLGKIMEIGDTESVIKEALHPYTKALTYAVPIPDPTVPMVKDVPIKGGIQAPVDLPEGCIFNPRCPFAKDICVRERPYLRVISKGRRVACHFAGEI